MTLEQFITDINGELSQDCNIPFQIPKKSLMRTIRHAKKYFYREYQYAVETCYLVINNTAYQTDEFKHSHSIILPDKVQSVVMVKEASGGFGIGDFDYGRLSAERLFVNHNLYGSNYDIEYFAVQSTYYDWINTLLRSEVTFDFNHLTKRFKLLGEQPYNNLVLRCLVQIDEEYLFDDELFFRYIYAQVRINLARILGTVTMPLIGDAEIDFSELKSEGKDDLSEIKDYMKEIDSADWFFTQ